MKLFEILEILSTGNIDLKYPFILFNFIGAIILWPFYRNEYTYKELVKKGGNEFVGLITILIILASIFYIYTIKYNMKKKDMIELIIKSNHENQLP